MPGAPPGHPAPAGQGRRHGQCLRRRQQPGGLRRACGRDAALEVDDGVRRAVHARRARAGRHGSARTGSVVGGTVRDCGACSRRPGSVGTSDTGRDAFDASACGSGHTAAGRSTTSRTEIASSAHTSPAMRSSSAYGCFCARSRFTRRRRERRSAATVPPQSNSTPVIGSGTGPDSSLDLYRERLRRQDIHRNRTDAAEQLERAGVTDLPLRSAGCRHSGSAPSRTAAGRGWPENSQKNGESSGSNGGATSTLSPFRNVGLLPMSVTVPTNVTVVPGRPDQERRVQHQGDRRGTAVVAINSTAAINVPIFNFITSS